MERWEGKVAVVTGASAGIGATTALALADHGMRVVGLARRQHKIQELNNAVKGRGTIRGLRCDLTNEEDILAAFRWIQNSFGGVDVLVNSAGFIGNKTVPASLLSGSSNEWRSVLDTNVVAVSICTREAVKSMRRRGDNGHIIHINSLAGHKVPFFPSTPLGIYPASKHAVTALTESLRIELMALKSRIKVTSISPGSVDTEMTRTFATNVLGIKDQLNGEQSYFKQLLPEDVSDAIVYALGTRPNVQVHELTIQPIGQRLCE
ncbi:farnesol dehydrogenase-like [Arctopsyche grandis]|uniref:farnesol dehydrogenase-like n=1 Tax=Arctopsyche grandis TaxID=121162 RepID=UPI00406D8C1E